MDNVVSCTTTVLNTEPEDHSYRNASVGGVFAALNAGASAAASPARASSVGRLQRLGNLPSQRNRHRHRQCHRPEAPCVPLLLELGDYCELICGKTVMRSLAAP